MFNGIFRQQSMSSSDLESKIAFFSDVEARCKHGTSSDDEICGVLPSMKTIFSGPGLTKCSHKKRQIVAQDTESSRRATRHFPRAGTHSSVSQHSSALESIDDNSRKIRNHDIGFDCSARNGANKPSTKVKQPRLRSGQLDIVPVQDMPLQPSCVEKKYSKQLSTSRRGPKPAARSTLSLVPQHKRIFQGISLYFIPPDKKNPARGIRIDKSIGYGAQWLQQWSKDVHYVVADDGLTHQDILKFLKLNQLPKEGVVAVNANWTSDCITNGSLVDPSLAPYRLEGPVSLERPPELGNRQDPEASLQLKSTREKDIFHRPHTPTPDMESVEQQTNPNESLQPYDTRSAPESVERDDPEPDCYENTEDPFSGIVAEVKAAAHLPIDFDDEETQSFQDPDEPLLESSSDEERRKSRRPKQKRKFVGMGASTWQSKFQCMQSHEIGEPESNPNQYTINILQQMADYYSSVQDQWRTRAYRQCISALRKQQKQIRTREEAERIPFIGERLAIKIEEISRTHKLQQLESRKLEPADKALKLFLGIYGVGYTLAAKWAQKGHRSIQDLVEAKVSLTQNQKVGIDHYADFTMRIPRQEVEQLGGIVQRALTIIDPNLRGTVGGSYRRGSSTSGDIDILITKPSTALSELRVLVLETLVPRLQEQGFLVTALAVTNRDSGSKWHGACQLPQHIGADSSTVNNDPKTNCNPWRRIDLLLVPSDEIGAALLYFTGNDIFNRSMRLLARRKGMRLNQKGLYDNVLRKGSDRLTDGTRIAGESEREIFEKLGVPWREAWERNI